MRAITVQEATSSAERPIPKQIGAVPESPFLADVRAPDWYQRLVYELSAGEIACPRRNAFLKELREAAKAVQSFEVVRRWALIGRIVRPRTGILALASGQGADLDEFVFGLVDFVCDLREADRLDLGWEPHLAARWRSIAAAAPEGLSGLFRISGGAPLLACRLSLALSAEREESWVVGDARNELLMATRYGALNREERRAVSGLAATAARN